MHTAPEFLLVFHASANVVARGIMFLECFCMRASRTDIVTTMSLVFVDGI